MLHLTNMLPDCVNALPPETVCLGVGYNMFEAIVHVCKCVMQSVVSMNIMFES